MIPAYNCAHYLPETLRSVLANQVPETDMQIEVVDDASTDADVEALVSTIGKGRIKYYRQPQNAGSLRNFETCINRAQGKLVHLLHGDDRVTDSFYGKINEVFTLFPEAGAVHCGLRYIGEKGEALYDQVLKVDRSVILTDWLVRVAERNPSQYVATVVKREVYEKLGSFYGITYGEDWEMWARIAKNYPVAYTPEILAEYREHASSISSNKFLAGQNFEDLIKVMQMIQELLPAEQRKEALQKSKKFYAHYGMRVAQQVWQSTKSKEGVQTQIKYALEMHLDPQLLWEAAKLYMKMTVRMA